MTTYAGKITERVKEDVIDKTDSNVRTFFDNLAQNYPNWYAIIISIAVILWVEGVIKLLEHYVISGKNPTSYALVAVLGLVILYFNDTRVLGVFKKEQGAIASLVQKAKSFL